MSPSAKRGEFCVKTLPILNVLIRLSVSIEVLRSKSFRQNDLVSEFETLDHIVENYFHADESGLQGKVFCITEHYDFILEQYAILKSDEKK